MSQQDDSKELLTWATCPADVLLMVFKELDMTSVFNCMDVNNYWRNIVDYYCEHNNLWDKLIEGGIDNEGLTFREKSAMGWRDQFFRAEQWLDIKNVTVGLHQHLQFDFIRNICVHKDYLIVVSNFNVKYFNIENFELIKTIHTSCLKYEESLSLILELTLPHYAETEFNILTLTNKLYKGQYSSAQINKMILYDISMFKIHLDSCLLIDMKNVLWIYTATENYWDCKILAKFYGNRNLINSIHIHRKNIYVLLKKGDVLLVDEKRKKFEKVYQFQLPAESVNVKLFMFHNRSIVFKVPNGDVNRYLYKGKDTLSITCPEVTAVLEHGHILILGYENGKIEIYLIRKLLDQLTTPELEFNLQSFLNTTSPNYKIASLDIHEGNTAHHLFVTTLYDIYELLLYH